MLRSLCLSLKLKRHENVPNQRRAGTSETARQTTKWHGTWATLLRLRIMRVKLQSRLSITNVFKVDKHIPEEIKRRPLLVANGKSCKGERGARRHRLASHARPYLTPRGGNKDMMKATLQNDWTLAYSSFKSDKLFQWVVAFCDAFHN